MLGLGTAFALFLRYLFREVESGDFVGFTGRWYEAVKASGLAASATSVSNYTPPYLYLLAGVAAWFPELSDVEAVKLPSVACDLVCAALVGGIVRIRYPTGPAPWFAGLATLLAPTVVVNGALWGQSDSIYTALLLACVYALMRGKPVLAMLAFAVGITLKLQAIFLAPLLLALWLRRALPLWTPLLVPAVYTLLMVPAAVLGRPWFDLFSIYVAQGGEFHDLTRNAPNLYAWLPARFYGPLLIAGAVLAAACVGGFAAFVFRSRAKLEPALVLRLGLLSLVLMPFVLPKMHERYFFPADVLAIAYAFWFPREYFVPVAIGFASYFAYQPFLQGYPILPIRALALLTGAVLLWMTIASGRALRSDPPTPDVARG